MRRARRLCALCACALAALALLPAARAQQNLTFAESVYVRFSDACRALVDLHSGSFSKNPDPVKAMKIYHLEGTTLRHWPVDEAYSELAKLFDITKQTKVVIHGFRDSALSAVPYDLAVAYNEKAMFNVLMLDAEELFNKWYPLSVHNARLAGRRLANLLANLEQFGANAEDFHLLGISLGAHVAGWAGKYFRRYKGRRLGRISGLDPAGPCFSHAYAEQRLDKQDASYTDVVHSNRLLQGAIESLGHADFYVNGGGPLQPGCATPGCSHQRAALLFAESVRRPRALVGVRCAAWRQFVGGGCGRELAVLGYGSSAGARGDFYLVTRPHAPFGLGVNGTRYDAQQSWLMNIMKT